MKIETGADRMLELLKEKKTMTFEDCAKQLKVPKSLVEKWAQLFDEKGMISIKYKFTKPFMIESLEKQEEKDNMMNYFIEKIFKELPEESNIGREIEETEDIIDKKEAEEKVELEKEKNTIIEKKDRNKKEDKNEEPMKNLALEKRGQVTVTYDVGKRSYFLKSEIIKSLIKKGLKK